MKRDREMEKLIDDLEEMLLRKNKAYGDSALNPIQVFSSIAPRMQLRIRMDDKLNRWLTVKDEDWEDTLMDLAGYAVLYAAGLITNEPNSKARIKNACQLLREEPLIDTKTVFSSLSPVEQVEYSLDIMMSDLKESMAPKPWLNFASLLVQYIHLRNQEAASHD